MDFIQYLINKKVLKEKKAQSVFNLIEENKEKLDLIISNFDEYLAKNIEVLKQTAEEKSNVISIEKSNELANIIKDIISKKERLDLIDLLKECLSTNDPEKDLKFINELSLVNKRVKSLGKDIEPIAIVCSRVSDLIEKFHKANDRIFVLSSIQENLEYCDMILDQILMPNK